MTSPHAYPPRGFTLVELMVVLVIVGILAAVAYPTYTSHLQRSRRADATALLTAVVQAQERYRSNRSVYASGEGALATLGVDQAKITNHYTVALSRLASATDFASGYVLTASPVPGSPQARDSRCNNLTVTLDNATLTYSSTNAAGANTSSSCWSR